MEFNWLLAAGNVIMPTLSSVVTWRISRRKRNNDFLKDLQGSIDLLSDKYTEALQELTNTRAANVDLVQKVHNQTNQIKALQEAMQSLQVENKKLITQNQELKDQQIKLTKEINNLKKKLTQNEAGK